MFLAVFVVTTLAALCFCLCLCLCLCICLCQFETFSVDDIKPMSAGRVPYDHQVYWQLPGGDYPKCSTAISASTFRRWRIAPHTLMFRQAQKPTTFSCFVFKRRFCSPDGGFGISANLKLAVPRQRQTDSGRWASNTGHGYDKARCYPQSKDRWPGTSFYGNGSCSGRY